MKPPCVVHAGDELLEEELRALKSRLKCSVQPTEWKDRIIARKGCYHMFSKKCVDNLIKTRNRKCPICACKWDAQDIAPVHGLAA